MLGAAAIVVLVFAMRGFPLGVPVADDFAFLARLAFQHPLDPFDSMGATYYWRPVSRQLYFSLLGLRVIDSPGTATTIHLLILLGTYVLIYRMARRGFSGPAAAAIASFPLLSEAARALVTWPSGAQHLLAGFFAVLTLHEALAGRWLTAFPAGLAASLSHETGFLAVLAVPVVAFFRKPGASRASRFMPLLGVAAVALVWWQGYSAANRHGVLLPRPPEGPSPLFKLPTLVGLGVQSALNLEDVTVLAGAILWTLYAALFAYALSRLRQPEARARVRAVAPALLIGGGLFLAGALSLTWLLPDWNAWRAWMPALALGLTLTVFLAAVSPGMALAFAGFRLLALLVAMPGPPVVLDEAPRTVSHMSFPRLVRLQRVVESTRRELARAYPRLGPGSVVRYWQLPLLAEVGFADSLAIPVWYRDRSVSWASASGEDIVRLRTDALVVYTRNAPLPAIAADPATVEIYRRAGRAHIEERYAEAESLYVRALSAGRWRSPLHGIIANSLARLRLGRGDLDGAIAFVDTAAANGVDDGDFWETCALIALASGDSAGAEQAARKSLEADPHSYAANQILSDLRRAGFRR